MMRRPRPSACEELTTEDNDTPIVVGLRLYDYYDCKWGVVTALDEYSPGWFDFRHDDGTRSILNGVRVSTVNPREGQ